MKRVSILAHAFIPGDTPEQPVTVYAGSVIDLDDSIAGQLVVAGKAAYVSKDVKLKETSAQHLAAADERAKTASVDPNVQLAALVAAAVQSAMSKPADPPKA